MFIDRERPTRVPPQSIPTHDVDGIDPLISHLMDLECFETARAMRLFLGDDRATRTCAGGRVSKAPVFDGSSS